MLEVTKNGEASHMEPMVVCAMGIVVYSGYLTVRDIIADLQQEGILVKALANKKRKDLATMGIFAYRGRLKYSKPQIEVRRPVWLTPQWSTHSRG
jgi:hypothetical protein